MIDEIPRNSLAQQELNDDAPARLFGQAVDSEAVKRKREEVTLPELELQVCEQAGALKRRRIESIQYCLEALETVGGADDRDRIRATDMIRTVAFGSSSSTTPEDKEVCVREFINNAGRQKESPGLDIKVGRMANKVVHCRLPSIRIP